MGRRTNQNTAYANLKDDPPLDESANSRISALPYQSSLGSCCTPASLVNERYRSFCYVVITRDNRDLIFSQKTRDHRRRLAQQRCVQLGIRLGRRLEIRPRLVDGGANSGIKRANLSRYLVTADRGGDRPTIGMSQHQDGSGTEDRCAVFQAGDNLWCRDVTSNPADEDVTDRLIEHQFHWHTGIGAREHSGERLLLFGCLGMQYFQVVLVGCHGARHVSLVSVHQLL